MGLEEAFERSRRDARARLILAEEIAILSAWLLPAVEEVFASGRHVLGVVDGPAQAIAEVLLQPGLAVARSVRDLLFAPAAAPAEGAEPALPDDDEEGRHPGLSCGEPAAPEVELSPALWAIAWIAWAAWQPNRKGPPRRLSRR
jgi:hypothetical protein